MTQDVRIITQKGLGRITLTRPSALHALNAPMCEAILSALERWRDDPTVHLVMVEHGMQAKRGRFSMSNTA